MSYRVAVVGATGAVGTVMLAKLASAASRPPRSSPSRPRAPRARSSRASARSSPSPRDHPGLRPGDLQRRRDNLSEWAPKFVEAGCVVVDNSSRWRRDDEIPLVVAEVNPDALERHRGLIANPNCSTMQLMVALKPILDAAGIERLIVSTYQSVSGTGVKAVDELVGADARRAPRRRAARADRLPAPDRVQRSRRRRQLQGRRRLHGRGAQDDVRDAQDPRGARHRHLRDLRARPGHLRALRVGERADARRRSRRTRSASCSAPRRGSSSSTIPSGNGYPTALGRRGPRRGVRRPHPARSLAPARAEPVGRERQPAQGRRHERRSRSPRPCTSAASSACRPAPRLETAADHGGGRSRAAALAGAAPAPVPRSRSARVQRAVAGAARKAGERARRRRARSGKRDRGDPAHPPAVARLDHEAPDGGLRPAPARARGAGWSDGAGDRPAGRWAA